MDALPTLAQLIAQGQQIYTQIERGILDLPDLPFSFNTLAQGLLPEPTTFTAAAALTTRQIHSGLKEAARLAKSSGVPTPQGFNTIMNGMDDLVAALHPVQRENIIQVTNQSVSRGFLDALVRAEEVKSFADEADLQTRLGTNSPYRAIFALRDPYADGALISIQVAYAKGLPGDILDVIAAKDAPAAAPDTACFYTVSNWRRMAVPIAKPFIFGVVDTIRAQKPEITNFVTLSPMYGFRKWVEKVDDATVDAIGAAAVMQGPLAEVKQAVSGAHNLAELQASPSYRDLTVLAAFYIVSGKKEPGRFTPYNDTAGFHPRNGAFFERLLPGGDRSAEGFAKSLGFMANYLYVPEKLEENAAAFPQGKIATSPAVRQILAGHVPS